MRKIFYLLITFMSAISVNAQVTMMNDVSTPYLDKLIDLARANYPKFKMTSAKVLSAKANYDKAKYGIFDFLALSYVYYPGNDFQVYGTGGSTNAFMNGYQLGVFVNVGTMLQKPANIRQAKQELNAAKYDKEVTDLDVDQEVRKRYFSYLETSNVLKIKTMSLTDADDAMKQIKYKFEKGEVTFDIYNQALLSYSTYSQEKIAAEANFLIAKTSLEEMLGTKLENVK